MKPGMIEQCIDDLNWLGLDWDGPIRIQSEGEAELRAAALELHRRGLAYPCVCTRKEIELAQSAPHSDDGTQRYPATCRDRFASIEDARASTGREPALRLRVPPGGLELLDGFVGPFSTDVDRDVGDFPITSRDGQIAYQLAVVVDDARDGVTEVLRGADLLPSTARQALLQDALGLPRPDWYHVPLVIDPTGRRLAKRAEDLSIASLRAAAVPAVAIVAWAARASGHEAPPHLRPADLLATFDLRRLPHTPATFDPTAPSPLALPPQNRPARP